MEEKVFRGGGFFRMTGRLVLGIFAITALSLVIGALVMVLWNWVMPAVFGLGTITYWQGFGITMLAKLLLGGFGKHAPAGPGSRWPGRRWHESYRERRFSSMGRMDAMYEDWWESEGAESFKSYMNKKTDSEED